MDLNLKKEQEKYLVSDYSGSDTTDEFYNISTFAKNMIIKDSLKYEEAESKDIVDSNGTYKFSLSKWFGDMLIQYCEKGLSDEDILALLNFVMAYNALVDRKLDELNTNLTNLKTKEGIDSDYQSKELAIIGECFPELNLAEAIDPVTKVFYPDSKLSYGMLMDFLRHKERIYLTAEPFPDMANETEKVIAAPYERQLIDNGCPLVFFDLRLIAGEDKPGLRQFLNNTFPNISRTMAASLSEEITEPIKIHIRILYKELNPEYRKDLNCDAIEMALFRPTLKVDNGNERYEYEVKTGMEAYLNVSEKRSTCITSMAANFVRNIAKDDYFIHDIYSYKYTQLPPLTKTAKPGYIVVGEGFSSDNLFIKVNGQYTQMKEFEEMANGEATDLDNRLNTNRFFIKINNTYHQISLEDIEYAYQRKGDGNYQEIKWSKDLEKPYYLPKAPITHYNPERYLSLNPTKMRYTSRKMIKAADGNYIEEFSLADTSVKPNPLVVYYTKYRERYSSIEAKLNSFSSGKSYYVRSFRQAENGEDGVRYKPSDEYSQLQYDTFGRIVDDCLFYSYVHTDNELETIEEGTEVEVSYALKLYNKAGDADTSDRSYIKLDEDKYGSLSRTRTYYRREIDYVAETTQLYRYGYGNPYLARTAKESEILYYYMGDSYISNEYGKYLYEREDISNFLTIYQETRDYYYRVLLNESFINEPEYKTYEKIFIIFWATERFMTNKLERRTDIDSYSKKDTQNFLESYGMNELSKIIVDSGDFGDIEPYAKKMLKSYKDLVQNKGSKNILDILKGIFSIDNTELTIYKNILYKEVKTVPVVDKNGNTRNEKKIGYKMVSINHDSQTLIKDVLSKLASSPTAEQYIQPNAASPKNGDIYWKVKINDGSLDDLVPSMTTTKYLDIEFLNEISQGYFLTGYVLSIVDYFLKAIDDYIGADNLDPGAMRERYEDINQGPGNEQTQWMSFWMGQILLSNSDIFEPEFVTLREALRAFRSLLWVYYERLVPASAGQDLTSTYPMTTFHFDPSQLFRTIEPLRAQETGNQYLERIKAKYGDNPYLTEYEDCQIDSSIGIKDGYDAEIEINKRNNNALMASIHRSINVLYKLAAIELKIATNEEPLANKAIAIGTDLPDLSESLVSALSDLLVLPKYLMNGELYNIDMSATLYNQIKRIHDVCYMGYFERGSGAQDIHDRVYDDSELFKIIQNTYVGETADDAKSAINNYAEYLDGILETTLSYNLLNAESNLLNFIKSCIDYFISYTSQIHNFTYKKLYKNYGETAGSYKDTYKITNITVQDADAFYYDERLNITYKSEETKTEEDI